MSTVQIILLMLLLPIELGPLGHQFALSLGSPDVFLVALWAFAWFASPTVGWRWAIIAGLALDLLSYTPFGIWTAQFILAVGIILLLKNRWFETSSVIQALLVLILISLVNATIMGIVLGQLDWLIIIRGSLFNTILGLIIYYIFATRLRLFQRWAGRQLS